MPGFVHRFIQGGETRTLLLLHGTGGNEDSLLSVAKVVDDEASILAVRGKVIENGMPRFFRRFSEGVFDVEDLKFRAVELADFVVGASESYGFPLASVVSLGYSNGANIATSMLLLRPETMERAVLLRPMVPFEPALLPDLKRKSVFISSGVRDQLIPKENVAQLETILKSASAEVTVNWEQSDHRLTKSELEKARSWLRER